MDHGTGTIEVGLRYNNTFAQFFGEGAIIMLFFYILGYASAKSGKPQAPGRSGQKRNTQFQGSTISTLLLYMRKINSKD